MLKKKKKNIHTQERGKIVQHKVTSQTLLKMYGNFYERVGHNKFHYCLYSLDRPTICPNVDTSSSTFSSWWLQDHLDLKFFFIIYKF